MANVDLGRYKRIVQYFWDPEPKNDDAARLPIWCLGKKYTSSLTSESDCPSSRRDSQSGQVLPQGLAKPSVEDDGNRYAEETEDERRGLHTVRGSGSEDESGWPPTFLDDFESRIWFTYRSNFPSITRSPDPNASSAMSLSVRIRSQLVDQGGFTSDTGWGCMIRSGQCLLANALLMLRLGRDWRRGTKQAEELQLLSLFADDPDAPFSIHRFVQHGASACGKHPGEWFGPSATARCIRALSEERANTGLRVYMTGDGSDIYEDAFLEVAKAGDGSFSPTLVLLGIRLGIDRVTPVYWEALKTSLRLSQSVGIAGGRPSSSHYFVGVQGDYFFYLDPHQTRPALPLHRSLTQYTAEDVESCHSRRLRRLHIKDMDPSMLIAFLIRDEADWRDWRDAVSHVQGKAVVHVSDRNLALHGHGAGRESAVDDVETFDDEDSGDEDDGEIVEHPSAST
ncbi:cysteine protease atg4 [Lasallia pustulata]|uniref:Cysteine protease n=1 Tax=Lasallia pustulata TaxID=136370 RepID=A0A1W5D207_9LECA|nr:cysteine protease atg4 [Lasallia pustulata]